MAQASPRAAGAPQRPRRTRRARGRDAPRENFSPCARAGQRAAEGGREKPQGALSNIQLISAREEVNVGAGCGRGAFPQREEHSHPDIGKVPPPHGQCHPDTENTTATCMLRAARVHTQTHGRTQTRPAYIKRHRKRQSSAPGTVRGPASCFLCGCFFACCAALPYYGWVHTL